MRKATETLSIHGVTLDEGATFELDVTLTVGDRSIPLSDNQAKQLLNASMQVRATRTKRTKPKASAAAASGGRVKADSRNDKVLALVDGGTNFTARVVVNEIARNGRAVLAEPGDTIQVGHNKNGYWYGTNARKGSQTSERSVRAIVNRSNVTGLRSS
jgi:hypothetical protein